MTVLDGKIAVVTGAGSDIGWASAGALVQGGARLAVTDLQGERGNMGPDCIAGSEIP